MQVRLAFLAREAGHMIDAETVYGKLHCIAIPHFVDTGNIPKNGILFSKSSGV